jgi:hypothetical protein
MLVRKPWHQWSTIIPGVGVLFAHTNPHWHVCNTEQVFAKLQFPQETVDVRSNVFVLCCYCWNSQPASLSCLLSVLRLRLWRCLSKLWLGICVTRDGPKLDKNWEPRRVDLSFCFVEKCVCVRVCVGMCVSMGIIYIYTYVTYMMYMMYMMYIM